MTTAIKKCKCEHTYQDKKYGKGKRVCNQLAKAGSAGNPSYSCTVCNAVISSSSG